MEEATSIKIFAGANYRRTFVLNNTDSDGNLTPVGDLTGATIKVKIANNINIADDEATFYTSTDSSLGYLTISDAANSEVTINIPDEVTTTFLDEGVKYKDFKFQVRYIDTSANVDDTTIIACIVERSLFDDE